MKKLLFLIFLLFPNIAMSDETANYKVIKNISHNVQIRQYENLLLAKISTKDKSQNNNFRNLFKFIGGKNNQEQKIKMTTPVFQENKQGEEIMSFVMPQKFDKNNLPKPNNKNIKIEILENSKFIAIEFSGRSTDKKFKKYRKILEEIIIENNIDANLENPINAYYNAPWTLPFLKRNEVLFKIE